MQPYVDPVTFASAPTGIDLEQIVPAGTDAQESAELVNVLLRATSWVDMHCRMRIAATRNTEQKQTRPNREGAVEVFPDAFPIIEIESAKWLSPDVGGTNTWTTVPATGIVVLEQSFLLNDRSYSCWRIPGTPRLLVQYTYTNGWPHTTLAAAAAADATTITVTDATGIASQAIASLSALNWNSASQRRILDGSQREDVTVTGVDGNLVTLSAPRAYPHTAGVVVTALPPAVEEATIHAACHFIRNKRGSGALVMGSRGPSGVQKGEKPQDDLDTAKELLEPFRRYRAA